MDTKMNSLDLTILDRTVLRVYVRQLLIFPFSRDGHQADSIKVLQTSLLETLKYYPFLAGVIDQTDPLTGHITVRYPDNVDWNTLSQIFKTSELEANKYDYEALCEDGFSPSRLPSDVFCPSALAEHPGLDDPFAAGLTTFIKGLPLPVFAAQAIFIPGGLVLSAYTHHSVVDGTGIAKIYQTWSGHTKDLGHHGLVRIQADAASLENMRRAFDSLMIDARPMDSSEFRPLNAPPLSPPLRDSLYKLSPRILVFSCPVILRLAESLSVITKERISAFTAFTALIWSQMTNARRTALMKKGIQKTTLGLAIDNRKHIGPLLPDDYIGNCAYGMSVSLPISSFPIVENVDADGMAPVARAISNSLAEVNLDWLKSRLLHFSKQLDPSKSWLDIDTRNGPDLFITSWMHIGADDVWSIPGTTKDEDGRWACKPMAIRKPQSEWEGGIQILPRQKGDQAPFEILVCLDEGEMERMIQGLKKGSWVERVVVG